MIRITRAQGGALEKELRSQGLDTSVHMAMRYTPPRADKAVKAALTNGARTLLVLPLYPHNSRATTGSSLNDLHRAIDACSKKPEVSEITDPRTKFGAVVVTVALMLVPNCSEAVVMNTAQ